jgi:hypothetical protein
MASRARQMTRGTFVGMGNRVGVGFMNDS